MPAIARVGDAITGHVGHHAGHVIEWTDDGPIYCSGHEVSGVETTGVPSVRVNGIPVIVVNDTGTTNCPCDGKGFTNIVGSSSVRINNRAVVRVGDRVDIHGQGVGTVTSGEETVQIGG